MKVALILDTFPCLSETFILNQITGLIDLKHDVRILARSNPQESKVHQDYYIHHLSKHTEYLPDIPKNRFLRNFIAMGKTLKLMTQHPLYTVKVISAGLNNYATLPMLSCINLFQWMMKYKSDIILCHYGPIGLIGLVLKAMNMPGRLVTYFHGYDVNRIPLKKGPQFYAPLFQKGDLFIANSRFTKGQLINLGCPEKKIEILPVCLKINKFVYSARMQPVDRPTQILTVGRLVEKKGHIYTLQAIHKLVEQGKNVHYVIAGDGELRNSLQKYVRENRLEAYVTFLGHVNEEEVVCHYRQSHLFVLPSITAEDGDREGQGLVLVEAQASGLPVVATQHNGFPDSILDGISGYLVPERNVAALAENLGFLIDHPEIWPKMGQSGRAFVEKNFDCSIINNKLSTLLEKMM